MAYQAPCQSRMIKLRNGIASAVTVSAAVKKLLACPRAVAGVAISIDDRIKRIVPQVGPPGNVGPRPRGKSGACECVPPVSGDRSGPRGGGGQGWRRQRRSGSRWQRGRRRCGSRRRSRAWCRRSGRRRSCWGGSGSFARCCGQRDHWFNRGTATTTRTQAANGDKGRCPSQQYPSLQVYAFTQGQGSSPKGSAQVGIAMSI